MIDKSERPCKRCGSLYEIWTQKIPMRDTGTVDCEVCGYEMYRWNGGLTYDAFLKERAEWPKPQ